MKNESKIKNFFKVDPKVQQEEQNRPKGKKVLKRAYNGVKIPWGQMIFGYVIGIAAVAVAALQTESLTKFAAGQITNIADVISYAVFSFLTWLVTMFAISAPLGEVKVATRMRKKIWNKVMRLPVSYFDRESPNRVVSRITWDASMSVMPFVLLRMAIMLFTVAIVMMAISSCHNTMLLVMMAGVPVVLILMTVTYKLMALSGFMASNRLSVFTAFLSERLANIKLIKASKAEEAETKKGEDIIDMRYKAGIFNVIAIDSPGFYVYIRMANGTVWSPTFRPCDTRLDDWEAAHSAGYSQFTAEKNDLKATLTLFVSLDCDALIWDVKLENLKNEPVECDVFAYTEFSQLAFQNEVKLGYYLKWNTEAHYDAATNAIHYLYTSWMQVDPKNAPVVWFSGSEQANSYCCNRDTFCGNYRDERNPIGVENGKLGNQNMAGGEPCGALHHHIALEAKSEKRLNYFLGVTPGALSDYAGAKDKTAETLTFLKAEGEAQRQFEKVKQWWSDHLGVYQSAIPDESAMRQINTWNPIQSVVTARFSRSVSSSASGIRGIGFRDSAQDLLAQAYRKPQWAKEMLLLLASQQFEDGHTVHTFWPDDGMLPQDITRSDDHIWMVYLAYAIIAETGDLSLLNEVVPFLGTDMKSAVNPATLWEHLLRGIEFTENHLGQHNLPLILFSDWNDHLGPFGRKGKGETVMVSQQHIYALKQLSELAAARGDNASVERFAQLIEKQETALSRFAWDGEWYLRGLDDEGQPVGSNANDYAKIWINTQSWMVIAGCGEPEKNIRAMNSVKKHMDTGMGLLINTPGIPASPDESNHKANGLPAGYSENGGIFCQTNCWAIIAEALLGRGDLAWKYYKQVMPHEVIQRIGLDAYKGEAYAYSSTMLGPDNEQFGQACVSQVTGTAAWMDVAATQYLLGIRPTLKGLVIDPCIPGDWDGFTVNRTYRGCKLHIRVENPDHVQKGVATVTFNGNAVNGNLLTDDLLHSCCQAEVTVIMG